VLGLSTFCTFPPKRPSDSRFQSFLACTASVAIVLSH
jgi:hypothetical protein